MFPEVLFAFAAISGIASGVFSRAGTATYTDNVSDTLFAFAAGGGFASATFARTGTATYTGDI